MIRIRVLLVDDSAEFLKSATAFLSRDGRVQVVGQARNGAECVQLAAALAPDLVLMDLAMPVMDGLTAAHILKSRPTPPRVVIVSLHDGVEYRRRVEIADADGFIGKPDFATDVVAMIDALFAGAPGASAEASRR